jgi:Na+/proline symporter
MSAIIYHRKRRSPEHESSPRPVPELVLVAVVVVELRHIIHELIAQFHDCLTPWDVFQKLWTVDEITFVGIVFVIVCIYLKVQEHLPKKRRKSSNRQRSKFSWVRTVAAIILLTALAAGIIGVWGSVQINGRSVRNGEDSHLVSCLHGRDCLDF